ncbi:hypothetical protein [Pseudomonas syringae group genomosp. 3]|uniref:hypothetical protein n=1 Tax=Pseudomonas syringae group genomosp. 3 TaxID=251701 RepID=UPI0006CD1A10|nr:hypothetical protein [Pseudomonas syringae group genomosp. 3]KPB83865.1 Uncharacterized protein AC505_0467 [Pseudomonas syringae pv. maculicola]RMV03385.1 hypothetical protein ALP19_03032 [Pseudomonas syringae pv. tomato]
MIECQQPQAHPARCGCEQAMSAAVLGAQNINSAMGTIDELRQQLADVSNERDGLQEQVRRLNSEGRTIILSGCEIKEADLIWGVMRNLHGNRRNTLPRWALVRNAFGTGSGVATALCRLFNLNPEEVLKL